MREASAPNRRESGDPTLFVLPPPAPKSARALRPLWRDLILKIWGEDPMICPCCKGTMKTAGTMIRREEVQFFLRLHGLWEGIIIIALPPPPRPPFDIESMEPLDLPPQWGWSDDFEAPPIDWWMDESPASRGRHPNSISVMAERSSSTRPIPSRWTIARYTRGTDPSLSPAPAKPVNRTIFNQ